MIYDEIRSMLAAPPTGADAPSLHEIEETLTVGYANALALAAARRRLERRSAAAAAALNTATEDPSTAELAALAQQLTVADGDLAQLRGLLPSLRVRATAVRAT